MMKIIKIKIEINKGSSFPITSLNYDPKKLIKEELVWKSATPDIVEFNDKSNEIRALQAGCGTIYAEDQNGVIRVFCTINVKNVEMTANAMARHVDNSNIEPVTLMYANAYGNTTNDTVIAMGYSGTFFNYAQNGNWVKLEKGISEKTGVQDYYSSLFRSELIRMNNIHSSLSSIQKSAWWVLNAYDIFKPIYDIANNKITIKYIKEEIAKSILEDNGIILGDQLRITLLGFGNWYESELNAESYYEEF